MKIRILAAAAALLGLSVVSPATACSVCRCGDPTFNALGTNIFSRGQFQLAVDIERLDKEQGADTPDSASLPSLLVAPLRATPLAHEDLGDHAGNETLRETRLVLTGSYAFSDRIQGVVRVPWSWRDLSSMEESLSTDGLGDPEVYGLFRLWSAPWKKGVGYGSWVSLVAGAKTAWGSNDETNGDMRLDEHVQPGTGSTDPFVGLSAVHLLDERSTVYGSFQVRRPGRNRAGYHYGDLVLANLGLERKLGKRFDAALELNARDARRDEIDRDGEKDPDTGGQIVFLSPRLLVDLGSGLVMRLTVQIPVLDNLNGHQKEKAVVDLGVTASF